MEPTLQAEPVDLPQLQSKLQQLLVTCSKVKQYWQLLKTKPSQLEVLAAGLPESFNSQRYPGSMLSGFLVRIYDEHSKLPVFAQLNTLKEDDSEKLVCELTVKASLVLPSVPVEMISDTADVHLNEALMTLAAAEVFGTSVLPADAHHILERRKRLDAVLAAQVTASGGDVQEVVSLTEQKTSKRNTAYVAPLKRATRTLAPAVNNPPRSPEPMHRESVSAAGTGLQPHIVTLSSLAAALTQPPLTATTQATDYLSAQPAPYAPNAEQAPSPKRARLSTPSSALPHLSAQAQLQTLQPPPGPANNSPCDALQPQAAVSAAKEGNFASLPASAVSTVAQQAGPVQQSMVRATKATEAPVQPIPSPPIWRKPAEIPQQTEPGTSGARHPPEVQATETMIPLPPQLNLLPAAEADNAAVTNQQRWDRLAAQSAGNVQYEEHSPQRDIATEQPLKLKAVASASSSDTSLCAAPSTDWEVAHKELSLLLPTSAHMQTAADSQHPGASLPVVSSPVKHSHGAARNISTAPDLAAADSVPVRSHLPLPALCKVEKTALHTRSVDHIMQTNFTPEAALLPPLDADLLKTERHTQTHLPVPQAPTCGQSLAILSCSQPETEPDINCAIKVQTVDAQAQVLAVAQPAPEAGPTKQPANPFVAQIAGLLLKGRYPPHKVVEHMWVPVLQQIKVEEVPDEQVIPILKDICRRNPSSAQRNGDSYTFLPEQVGNKQEREFFKALLSRVKPVYEQQRARQQPQVAPHSGVSEPSRPAEVVPPAAAPTLPITQPHQSSRLTSTTAAFSACRNAAAVTHLPLSAPALQHSSSQQSQFIVALPGLAAPLHSTTPAVQTGACEASLPAATEPANNPPPVLAQGLPPKLPTAVPAPAAPAPLLPPTTNPVCAAAHFTATTSAASQPQPVAFLSKPAEQQPKVASLMQTSVSANTGAMPSINPLVSALKVVHPTSSQQARATQPHAAVPVPTLKGTVAATTGDKKAAAAAAAYPTRKQPECALCAAADQAPKVWRGRIRMQTGVAVHACMHAVPRPGTRGPDIEAKSLSLLPCEIPVAGAVRNYDWPAAHHCLNPQMGLLVPLDTASAQELDKCLEAFHRRSLDAFAKLRAECASASKHPPRESDVAARACGASVDENVWSSEKGCVVESKLRVYFFDARSSLLQHHLLPALHGLGRDLVESLHAAVALVDDRKYEPGR